MHHHLMTAALAFAGFTTSVVTADAIVTVCASGCDHVSINSAILAVDNGGVIQLSAETYSEGSVINTQGRALTILGATDKDGNAASILDGGASHDVINCVSSETSATIFKNLVIRNGIRGMQNTFANPTMINCTFTLNSTTNDGGGMFNYGSSPTLTNCRFTNNSANEGGGMYNSQDSNPTLTDCIFANNSSSFDGGGLYNYGSSPTLTDCMFTSNSSANEGGGMYSQNSDQNSNPILTGCTFTGNSAEYSGGGIYSFECSASLSKCRMWCNTPNSIDGKYADEGCNCIRDSCVGCPPLADSDEDGTLDCFDDCPNDPEKTEPGSCGCGVVDTNVNGDVDCDGDYDEDDVRAGMSDFGITEGTPGDLDGDNDVDPVDFVLLRSLIGVENLGCLVADINGDGIVNGGDLGILLSSWGTCVAP